MSRSLIMGMALLTLAGCGDQPRATDLPDRGDIAVVQEEQSSQRAAAQQTQAAVAVARSQTLEARLTRLEAEVDTLKAQAATADSLKSALADIGASAAAPPTMMVPTPPPAPARAGARIADSTPNALSPASTASATAAPTAVSGKSRRADTQTAGGAPMRKSQRAKSNAALLQAQIAPNGVLQQPRQPKLGYDGL